MIKNMGKADQAIRIMAAAIIIILYFTNVISGTLAIALLAVAGIFILTGIVRFCPLYFPFRISTAGKSNQK